MLVVCLFRRRRLSWRGSTRASGSPSRTRWGDRAGESNAATAVAVGVGVVTVAADVDNGGELVVAAADPAAAVAVGVVTVAAVVDDGGDTEVGGDGGAAAGSATLYGGYSCRRL